MSFQTGLSNLGSGFGNIGQASLGKIKANPINTVIITILILLVLLMLILFILEMSIGLFRRNLPGESCKKDSNCGKGLVCQDKECTIP